ncbi:MAG: glycerophosphodiester phosphodiesterase, partial [Flammeovirgaceae bacterium]|nr:glycerophosphodiester phosphodiesterase [Flammeovirgaceae bacterium]
MKIAIRLLLVVVYGAISVRCTTENPIIVPRLLPPISGLTKIPEATKPVMDGVYRVVRGSERFGEQVVVKWRGDRLSIFSNNNYIVLPTGFKDSTIFLQGYWRNPQSDAAGLASFAIAKTEGARNLLKGLPSTNTQIKGVYGNGDAAPNQEFTLQYLRPFSAEVKSKDFFVVAHRAGGRTSDRLPASENSIRMINFTEHLGSNGIEIDIRLTKDKVPVLYHDEDINIRLTIKGPLNGNINSFTYAQINTFVWLIRGEKIPKLE